LKPRAVLILLFALTGCIRHARTDQYGLVHRQNYVYRRLNEGDFAIAAADYEALRLALIEIGCGKKYVCEVEMSGEVFDVQVHTK